MGLLDKIFSPLKTLESLLRKVPMFEKFEEGIPMKAKVIIAVLVLFIFLIAGFAGFEMYDFTQNNPKFCVSCHLMKEAYTAWEESSHSEINCHDCHHITIPEANMLMFNFVVHRPETVPERHGKIIVPWDKCIACHWEKKDGYEEAPLINRSTIHAKHVFAEQVECSKCHGYKVHQFLPEERFCQQCHTDKEVHGVGMESLACLNCHSDDTKNLRPNRDKCLYCHADGQGGDDLRARMKEEGSMDVRNFTPSDETIAKAIKINVPKDAPMQFDCYNCHKPHVSNRPDWGNCVDCHRNVQKVGKHSLHINGMGMSCKDCHVPHVWTINKAQAKKTCTSCHEYKSPEQFLAGN